MARITFKVGPVTRSLAAFNGFDGLTRVCIRYQTKDGVRRCKKFKVKKKSCPKGFRRARGKCAPSRRKTRR